MGKNSDPVKHILYEAVPPGFSVAYRKEKADRHMPPHTHNAAEIYFNMTDLPNVLLGGKLCPVAAGSLILFPAYCIHRTVRNLGEIYERYVLLVQTDWFEKAMADSAGAFRYLGDAEHPIIIPLNASMLGPLQQQFRILLSYGNTLSPGSLSAFFALMQTLDRLLKASAEENTPAMSIPQQRVNSIISYLHGHLCEAVSMADLSEKFYLDADYIARIFKKYTGTTIRRYIALQRITQAGTLLKAGYSATEAGRRVGYQDYSLFYRNFHHIMGISPAEFVTKQQDKKVT